MHKGDSLGVDFRASIAIPVRLCGKKKIGYFFLTLAGPEATTGLDDDEASTFFIPETQKN
jgi:hypothetical protein